MSKNRLQTNYVLFKGCHHMQFVLCPTLLLPPSVRCETNNVGDYDEDVTAVAVTASGSAVSKCGVVVRYFADGWMGKDDEHDNVVVYLLKASLLLSSTKQ